MVEAVLVLPVVILLICLIYQLAVIQYHNTVSRAEAMRIANRAAMSWNLIGGAEHNILLEDMKGMEGEETEEKSGKNAIHTRNYMQHDPYRFFMELFTAGSQKKQNLGRYLDVNMKALGELACGITSEDASQIGSDSAIHFFNRYVSVRIDNVYANPIQDVLANLGLQVGTQYSVEARARLTEPAEFVRSISFIEEIIGEVLQKKLEPAAGESQADR